MTLKERELRKVIFDNHPDRGDFLERLEPTLKKAGELGYALQESTSPSSTPSVQTRKETLVLID